MNAIVEQARDGQRDYATPEDVTDVLASGAPADQVVRDALEVLGEVAGIGVEDAQLFAFSALEAHKTGWQPTDPRLVRIAAAMGEGCNGRRDPGSDPWILSVLYQRFREGTPDRSFGDCKLLAFAEFIAQVLNGEEPI